MKNTFRFALGLIFIVAVTACKQKPEQNKLQVVGSTNNQWTGVAVSQKGRVFVNFPRWSDSIPISVAEIIEGEVKAYPNKEWQQLDINSFVAVQSVVIDDENRLWVLDTRNPVFKGVMEEGPVLYQFNLESNQLEQTYNFEPGVFKPNSYFNDVRVDTNQEIAYMTDSGDGAIIVLDLKSGKSERYLDNHVSTESEKDHLICDGIKWENSVHSDGIALSPDGQYLYYIALTGHTLYRIPTAVFTDDELSEEELEQKVEMVKTIPATDGMMFDKAGNLWLGGLEDNSINVLKKDGELEKVIQDKEIRWADSFAMDKEGNVYFTTSQIHLPPAKRKEFTVLKLKIK